MEGIDYRMFQEDGWGGAVYPQQEGEQGPIIYFDTDDIDADLAKVRELGGDAEDKQPIPHVGWFARCKDTEGNCFSLFQSDESVAPPTAVGPRRPLAPPTALCSRVARALRRAVRGGIARIWLPEGALSPRLDTLLTPDTDGKLYSSKTLQNYLNTFMANIGGSPWAAVQTQYCRNVPIGTTSCAGIPGAEYITNPKHQLKGVWTDPTPVPDDIVTLGLAENLVDDPIAMEAMRASAHFTYDPNATYIILTPPRPIATGQPVYCGYHTQTTSIDGLGNPYRIEYSFIPWQNTDWPGLGQGCGLHNVNATSNAFGNGIFDSWSIVVGHEYSEAVTDPDNFFAIQDGWNDDQTSENADKCAWTETQNITLGGHQFAVQPTWSNEAFDAGKDPCAVSR